ncbi:MAG: hypothetical protein ACE5HT_16680 [Gemmatimonadales bacterium]
MSDDGEMTEIVTALLETEPFQWSQERAALSVEPDENVPNTINVVAGVPDEGDWEFLLEQWLTAALIAPYREQRSKVLTSSRARFGVMVRSRP